jgi:hypothetical protein
MSRIFLSHSSANSAEAIAVRDWLIEQGWNESFLDLDPERGLKAGQRWQQALKQAAERCEVVLFLIRRHGRHPNGAWPNSCSPNRSAKRSSASLSSRPVRRSRSPRKGCSVGSANCW